MNDRDVTALLERRAAAVPSSRPPIDAIIDAAPGGRPHGHRTAFLAAAAVLALVIGAGVVWDSSRDDASPPPPTDTTLPVHDGYRWFAMNGIAVEVPASWTTASVGSCPPESVDAVVFDQEANAVCQDPRIDPQASSVHFESLDSRNFIAEMARPSQQHTISIGGHRALATDLVELNCPPRSPVDCESVSGASVEVSELDVVIWVESPNPSTVEDVLASARALPDGYVAVPDLTGAAHSSAGRTVLELGLKPESLCSDGGQVCDLGLTIAQTDPLAGSVVPIGSVVALLAVHTTPNAGFPPSALIQTDGRLEVAIAGSSTCPLRATRIASVGEQHVRVRIGGSGGSDTPCTADVKTYTSRIALPAGVRHDEPVIVELVTGSGYLRDAVLAYPQRLGNEG
jgi:hypothetical protein